MAQSDNIQRAWLEGFSEAVAQRIHVRTKRVSRIVIYKKVRSYVTNTRGWYCDLGYVRGDRTSSLTIWLDHWVRYPDRKLYAGYGSSNLGFLSTMREAVSAEFGPLTEFGNEAWAWSEDGRSCHLTVPLRSELFGRPLVELYNIGGPDGYIGVHYSRTPAFDSVPPPALAESVSRFLAAVARSAMATLATADSDAGYSALENRENLRLHLRRERSAKLARLAKLRDSFVCQVCGFDFAARYGSLGEGLAEAHHIRGLALNVAPVETVLDDLITVCANCHRVLHRMRGSPSDVGELRRAVRRRLTTNGGGAYVR